ncbi:hypothetical protein GCM10009430_32530 [Aquimarina litoralis]|uniref:HTH araC/xylS-type domain-containing protein n=1 Tax=Aquimarina litoralis TaxID=584605 RepID=A0ABN1J1N8_9FLAO
MNIHIDITKDIINQFVEPLSTKVIDDEITFNNTLGKGQIERRNFNDKIELLKFSFQLSIPITLTSSNPTDSEYLLININLSKFGVHKKVNDTSISVQRNLPIGILFYTPNIEVSSTSATKMPFEIVLLKFKKSFLSEIDYGNLTILTNTTKVLVYEDLDIDSESCLRIILNQESSKLKAYSKILELLDINFQKLAKREVEDKYEELHPLDLKGLFTAATLLRDPIMDKTFSIDELSEVANMGKTKFKMLFKQVFGLPPISYKQKIKMEYAKEKLSSKEMSASEISYQIGYSHPSKFTIAYKKYFGVLPSSI